LKNKDKISKGISKRIQELSYAKFISASTSTEEHQKKQDIIRRTE
jgi:hypothetical protein